MRFILIIGCCFISFLSYAQNISIYGYTKESKSLESIPYVHIFLDSKVGTYSNAYGFYSLEIPKGENIVLSFSSVGYQDLQISINTHKDSSINFFLEPKIHELKDVTILSKNENDNFKNISHIKIPSQNIDKVAGFLGEKDVIKVIQLLPGAQRGIEGSNALHIRGGGSDQNLILLDDAPVYNSNHLFGFLSTFNHDAIKNVDFWKAGFPAQYGGRLSSVISLQTKDGNKEELKGKGGIGILSSRFTLEGPIIKNNSSFIFSARRSYFDLILKPLQSEKDKFGYYLYDINSKFNFTLDSKNRFFVSTYLGQDQLSFSGKNDSGASTFDYKSGMGWGNFTTSLRWNHILNQKIFINTTLIYSKYQFRLKYFNNKTGRNSETIWEKYNSGIQDIAFKTDFDYSVSNKNQVKAGLFYSRRNI